MLLPCKIVAGFPRPLFPEKNGKKAGKKLEKSREKLEISCEKLKKS